MQEQPEEVILCSECFMDEGLRIGAHAIGRSDDSRCPRCGKVTGRKLSRSATSQLAYQFFTWGSRHRGLFGGAPLIVSNEMRKSNIRLAAWSGDDLRLFEDTLGLGFFLYGPRLWMLGEVEPLKALQTAETRTEILDRIVTEYPGMNLERGERFYRLRKGPTTPADPLGYDSPPLHLLGEGRLESTDMPIFYGSRDLETCIHECRLTVLDDSFLATVTPTSGLRLLDLTALLVEKEVSEFESLDMAVHMLFLAASHSYPITRELARRARAFGFDGILYPSFYSLARTGAEPFPTIMGISVRRIPDFSETVRLNTIPNIALFGHPLQEKKLEVLCVNRLVLAQVSYAVVLGPVGVTHDPDADTKVIPMPEREETSVPAPEPLNDAMSLLVRDLNRHLDKQHSTNSTIDDLVAIGRQKLSL